jgi:SAM-dependent methyltransferase
MSHVDDALEALGRVDIALIDQFQRGRFRKPGRVLDAGCGAGRNLDLFARAGHELWLLDADAHAVESARVHCERLGHPVDKRHTRVGALETAELPAASFDAVLAIAVLHFARDRAHWEAQLDALWRCVAPGGVLFARLASSIGIEAHITPLGNGRFRLGDGSTRYLVGLADLLEATRVRDGELLDPIKTVNVQDLRAMTTWVVRRPE